MKSAFSKPKSQTSNRYILFYKPYAVLSQFSPEEGKQTLSDFLSLPKNIYPVGRLDFDSEGLLLLTNDNEVKNRLTDPAFEHPKTYFAQVENIPTESALQQLRNGVNIEGKITKPAEAELIHEEPLFPPRSAPIRYRKEIPTAWIKIVLTEGRNRQVRKMTAAVGHPTLRLIRTKIGNLQIGTMKPGEFSEIVAQQIFS